MTSASRVFPSMLSSVAVLVIFLIAVKIWQKQPKGGFTLAHNVKMQSIKTEIYGGWS